MPSGHVREDLDDELKALMARELPDYHAEILARSTGNQIRLIYASELPGYGKGMMGLCGDAGVVVQPMTGAGVFKGLSSAADLVDAFGPSCRRGDSRGRLVEAPGRGRPPHACAWQPDGGRLHLEHD